MPAGVAPGHTVARPLLQLLVLNLSSWFLPAPLHTWRCRSCTLLESPHFRFWLDVHMDLGVGRHDSVRDLFGKLAVGVSPPYVPMHFALSNIWPRQLLYANAIDAWTEAMSGTLTRSMLEMQDIRSWLLQAAGCRHSAQSRIAVARESRPNTCAISSEREDADKPHIFFCVAQVSATNRGSMHINTHEVSRK